MSARPGTSALSASESRVEIGRLLIVMEDEIGDLADKGLNAAFIGRYYNPGSVAREAKLLQRGGDDAPWPPCRTAGW